VRTIKVSEKSGVLYVRLNRPEKHNAFNPEMIADLTKVFQTTATREDLVAIWLEGEGKSFCAGGDLEWMRSMADYTHEENLADAERLFDLFKIMADCSVPLLGLIHGAVYGGGLGLVAVCDVVAAETNTRFCFSEARIGIAPAVISPFVLRKSTPGHARELMITAKEFGVDAAVRSGWVHFSGEKTEAENYLRQTVSDLEKCARGGVRVAKQLMNFISMESWDKLRMECAQVIAERRASPEGQEGLRSFLEKRQPSWRRGIE